MPRLKSSLLAFLFLAWLLVTIIVNGLASQNERAPLLPKDASCAKGLIVSLKGGKNECHGVIVRDDLVLTTGACANDSTFMVLPNGHGAEKKAVEPVAMNDNSGDNRTLLFRSEGGQRRLALLKVKLESYHRNSGWPRLRVYLSPNATHHRRESAFQIHCDGNRPILSSIASGGEVLFVGSLRQQLPELLWDVPSSLSSTAEMVNGSERWWAPRRSREEHLATIATWKNKYEGPEGSLSLAHQSVVLEMEDPRDGRYWTCLDPYFHYWKFQVPFSGEDFFSWLDYGSGRKVELEECQRQQLNATHIRVFTQEERDAAVVDVQVFANGKRVKLFYRKSGLPVPKGTMLFVLSTDGTLYVAKEERRTVKHVSIEAGAPLVCAGEFKIRNNGVVGTVIGSSGHYKPRMDHVAALYKFFNLLGAKREAMVWFRLNDRGEWERIFK